MNDRGLLELAAKAAGLPHKWVPMLNCMIHIIDAGNSETWNPLEDDGDALRLAVKLRLALLFPMDGDTYPRVGAGQVGGKDCAKMENAHPDPHAATRRAIVRAAAAIGERA